jgi:transcriptional regulator with XRE-family HTH domain
MNPLAEIVRNRLAELKAKGISQTDIARRAGKPDGQSLLSHVALGMRKFPAGDLEAWATALELGGAEREAFIRIATEATYLLVASEVMAEGEEAKGMRIWRELTALRAELFATRSQLLRGQAQLADANARVLSLEKKVELLLQRKKAGPKRGDTEG